MVFQTFLGPGRGRLLRILKGEGETPPVILGCSRKKVGNGALGATSGVAPTTWPESQCETQGPRNGLATAARPAPPTRICRVRKQWGRLKANAMLQKRGARSVPKHYFAHCVRQCAKKVGNRNRASSEQAKHCCGLHRTHLLIKLQAWSWRSGCRRSTVTKPSQSDATQSQDAPVSTDAASVLLSAKCSFPTTGDQTAPGPLPNIS